MKSWFKDPVWKGIENQEEWMEKYCGEKYSFESQVTNGNQQPQICERRTNSNVKSSGSKDSVNACSSHMKHAKGKQESGKDKNSNIGETITYGLLLGTEIAGQILMAFLPGMH